ncbi:unnamed protein product, partial [Mesorhabditis belari]|uniref:Uncharacterized protein n=1 Tax=Mesorhabditis belari TaxID=2138241 RepID=A0AAF3FH92_9BILA
MTDYIKQVTVTGDVSTMGLMSAELDSWIDEVAKEIWEQKPEIGVVHVQGLLSSPEARDLSDHIANGIASNSQIRGHFQAIRGFFDVKNTGLGSLYFFKNADDVRFYDRFSNSGYRSVERGEQIAIGPSECDGFISSTFEQTFNFSTAFYGNDGNRDISNQRTGFLLTRFRIYGKEITFVNLSLHSVPFEDVNEIVEQPQVTRAAGQRQKEIDMLMNELDSEGLKDDAIIVAGAFNSQLHETAMLGDLASTQRASTFARTRDDGRLEAIEQRDRHGRSTVTVEEHRFDLHSIHDWFFKLGRGQMVKKYNGELAQVVFGGKLHEESVFFQPSRHYGMNPKTGKEEFLRHLCPSWADRVLYNSVMSDLFRHDSFCASGLYYGIVGEKRNIGEHKPVSLHATICLK